MDVDVGKAQTASLSTKITVIVFWGLILVGLIFAAILLHNMQETTQESREALADNIAYQVYVALDHAGLEASADLSNRLYLLGDRYPELSIALHHGGKPLGAVGQTAQDEGGQTIKRIVRITQGNGERVSAELLINFPSLEDALHSQRSMLLIGLGILLLVFGSVIKGLLDHILSMPLRKMVTTARAISTGKTDLSFDDMRNDEFGYVARFINEAVGKLRVSQEEAWQAKELAEVTLHSIGEGVVTTDREGRVVFMNPVAEHMIGSSLAASKGKSLPDIMPMVDQDSGETIPNPITQCLYENRSIELDANSAVLRKDRDEYPVEVSVAPISRKGSEVHGAVMVLHDVREARALQRELSYQASHDPLTGLYNRREFEQELRRAHERAKRDGEEHTLCYLDLDQFKVVNDTCGHAAGDRLLQELTAQLRTKLRKSDVLARLGGDEFGLLLAHCATTRAVEVAENLKSTISEFRFIWQDKAFQVGVSIGLVPVTESQSCTAEILSAADMACYEAKENGRNRVHVYRLDDEGLHRRRDEMSMVSAVRRALAEERFELFAQPIACINNDKTVHYELLVRMRDPESGYVAPGAFLPAAERYQLMSSIDRWVVGEAVQLLVQQERLGNPINISVNLSGQSIGEESFLAYVLEQIDEVRGSADRICFEITETVAVNNLSLAVNFIENVKRFGSKFSLDDFGAGVSSFGYLKNLPVDYVKIDGVFVRAIHENEVDQAMVKAIVDVSNVMGIQTVAEFVENEESFNVLRDIGIDYAQGYWIEKPRPLAEIFAARHERNRTPLRVVRSG